MWLRVVVFFVVLLVPARAWAGDYEDAKKADDEFRFADALTLYERAADPHTSQGAIAASRAEVLRAHAEGDFRPYAELERVRRTPSAAAAEKLAHDADGFPPGKTRVESWVVGAESALAGGGNAEPYLRKIIADPVSDPVLVRKARTDLVGALTQRNDFASARAVAEDDPTLAPLVKRLARRRYVHLASIAALISLPLFALASIFRNRQKAFPALRKIAPIALAYGAWIALAGGGMAGSYETGTSKPFVYFAVTALFVILLARAWGATGRSSRTARITRALLAASACFAAGFLVLEQVDVAYLDSLSL